MTTNEYRWLNKPAQAFLDADYLAPGETVDSKVDSIIAKAKSILGDSWDAVQFKENFKKGWYSFSSPIWSNFGTPRGLPISCFGSFIDDSMDSILYTHAEIGIMSKYGGGTSAVVSQLRERGSPISHNNGHSSGMMHFVPIYDSIINIVSQGSVRRGSCAAYCSLAHPEIMEFLKIRSEGHALQNLNFAVIVPSGWMATLKKANNHPDRDKNRDIWAEVLNIRSKIGYPFIFFEENANKYAADVYQKLGMKINHSNLCTEIMLPDTEDESFVCDLSSMNILYFEEWKDTNAVELLTFFLDAVMTDFIQKAKKIRFFERAVKFAERHRAIGIGWLGWHSFLQSKMIAYGSIQSHYWNKKVGKTIFDQAYAASAKLADIYGVPEVLAEAGIHRRNTTLVAIAPTKSSSFILGQASEGTEPMLNNVFIKDLAKIKHTIRNPFLEKLLDEKGKNVDRVWNDILLREGSVQHLDFLTKDEKDVFKTFSEISQHDVLTLAAQRQPYIDQGQSVNIMIHPKTDPKDVKKLYDFAFESGLKSLYYQYSVNAAQEFSRELMICSSCEA